jgi:hypothetical protein
MVRVAGAARGRQQGRPGQWVRGCPSSRSTTPPVLAPCVPRPVFLLFAMVEYIRVAGVPPALISLPSSAHHVPCHVLVRSRCEVQRIPQPPSRSLHASPSPSQSLDAVARQSPRLPQAHCRAGSHAPSSPSRPSTSSGPKLPASSPSHAEVRTSSTCCRLPLDVYQLPRLASASCHHMKSEIIN